MLTRRGWSLAGAGLGLVVGGRLLGLAELYVVATALLALLAGASLWNRTRTVRLRAARAVPERLVVGGDGRIELSVTSRRRVPTLALTDSFDDGRRSARFLLPPLAAGERARAAYRIPTDRRGRHVLGPLEADLTDPFGLTGRTIAVAAPQDVVVYPRVHTVAPPPEGAGGELDPEAPLRSGRPEPSGEFHSLREYGVGDDLRRVNWKATARHQRLMIRHDELHRRAPVLVLLDTRRTAHDEASFEAAIEAAASIVAALERAGRPVELFGADGGRIGTPGRRHLASVLDALAVLEPAAEERLEPGLLARRARALCAVMGRVGADDARMIGLIARPGAAVTLVSTSGTTVPPIPGARRVPPVVVDAAPGRPFPQVWNQAVSQWHRSHPRRPSPSRP